VLAPGGNWLIPWHMGVLTKHGHFVNFRRLLPHEQNTFGAWWFLGSFQGIPASQWREILGRRGRVRVLPAGLGVTALLAGYVALLLPWLLVWSVWPVLWTIGWAVQAILIRTRKARRRAA
jgi:hypothetical protein